MAEPLTEIIIAGFLAATIRQAVPILLAGSGDLLVQKSGVLNLGMEGVMSVGAFTAVMASFFTGSPIVGIIIAAISGIAMMLLKGILSITLGSDQAVTGIGIWFLGIGLTSYGARILYGAGGVPNVIGFTPLPIPILSQIPNIGPILFNHDIILYSAYPILGVFAYVLYRTTWGLKIRAVGDNPAAADSKGINVALTRYLALVVGGAMAGLGGAYLSLVDLKTFFDGMVAGRGWIAISLVIFGQWNPKRMLIGALIFGGASALAFRVQAFSLPIPESFSLMLPYAMTILAFLFARKRGGAPLAWGEPYRREG
jgi:simple sugar transport system permease protein